MILTILTRMSNDEQRLQLLKTLRNKLSNYNLNWSHIKNILNLFSTNHFHILQFLLLNIKNLPEKIHLDEFIYLINQSTDNNEYLKVRLIEQLYEKINIDNENDLDKLKNLFQNNSLKIKIENFIRNNQIISKNILSSIDDISYTSLNCSQQILIPLLVKQEDEFIHRSISMSSSNSSLSSSSSSEENIPIRTRSFMMAIKNTFERLKETSS